MWTRMWPAIDAKIRYLGLGEAEVFPSSRSRLIRLERRFVPLLVTTLLPILLLPWTAHGQGYARLILAVVISALIVQTMRSLPLLIPSPRAPLWVGAYRLLGLADLVVVWWLVYERRNTGETFRVEFFLLSLFFVLSLARLVRLLAHVPRVNVQVLAGAAAGYVLLGLTGGMMATALQMIDFHAFNLGSTADHQLILDRLTYYSFVTISGLGYGDIVPTNAFGERFVILMGLASTLYMALLTGLLLGRFLGSQESNLLAEDLDRSKD